MQRFLNIMFPVIMLASAQALAARGTQLATRGGSRW
ncbi:hypothetical protein GGR44_002417 [Sphingobium fontiphilum]|uniref:Conjugal transfer protein TrbC n=1 Tax=Sphingobium fontiphilum TaxID=944425 RepID=A0A7W6DJZ6_9SPHN|nr:hypothetical protein [Sphingobium fontiphilum]